MHQAPWTPSVDRCSLTKRDKINSEASQSYAGLIAKPELIKDNITEKGLSTLQLLPGMMLKNSLFSTTHLLILAEGHEFTEHSIDKLIEYEQNQKHHFTVVVEQSSL